MTDERIKEEFEKWIDSPSSPQELDIFDTGEIDRAGFYAGFRAAERMAKIEVLEEVARMMDKLRFFSEYDHKGAKDRIACMIADIEKYR